MWYLKAREDMINEGQKLHVESIWNQIWKWWQ